MQSAQRTEFNHALEFAIRRANEADLPLVVFFALKPDFPEANRRHYHFMLEGLQEVEKSLAKRGIKFMLRIGEPVDIFLELARDAMLAITDKSYLRLERSWRQEIIAEAKLPIYELESNVVVPVEEASDKEEYAAYTIRKKINRQLDKYLKPIKQTDVLHSSLDLDLTGESLVDIDKLLAALDVDDSVNEVREVSGGYSKAKERLEIFITEKLADYDQYSNDPTKDYQSGLSPYLHYGQISPVEIALAVKNSEKESEDFLEQLIVRRELAINFVYYNPEYDNLDEVLPDWAVETLEEHSSDQREYNYSLREFEEALTHDKYWNAAQKELLTTGKIHGYMRMYWGKKILEWCDDYKKAFKIALKLNNKYQLDGRDPNGYTGIAWCFGKHDRAWTERDIFGKVRYMNANGLKRKFNIDEYVKQVNNYQLF